MRISRFVLAAAMGLALAQGACDSKPAPDVAAPPSAASAAASPAQQQAARELYKRVGGGRNAELGAEAIMPAIKANPALAPYEDVFREWYRKVLTESNLEEEIVQLYAVAFSEPELRELSAFYGSPLGQKAIAKIPELMQRGAEIGAKAAEEHMGELQQMIADRRAADAGKEAGKPAAPEDEPGKP